jgi:hypothetical protein
VNVQELELPEPSIAVHVMVFVPIGKTEPLVGELLSCGALSQLSETVGRGKVTAAPPESCGASATIMFAGHAIIGAVVSSTLTVCEQKALLLQESVAFHVRVVMKAPPARGLVIVPETMRVTFVSAHVSETVGGSKVHGCPHSTVRLLTQTRDGGAESTIVTSCENHATFVHSSTACQTRVAANVLPQSGLVAVE